VGAGHGTILGGHFTTTGAVVMKHKARRKAKKQVLALLANGPVGTQGVIEGLGYSAGNFVLTQMIGDRHGEWDDSPHQVALSKLIASGKVQWRRNENLNVEYALAGTWRNDQCGDTSPGIARIDRFMDAVMESIGAEPYYTSDGAYTPAVLAKTATLLHDTPCLGVREVDSKTLTKSVNLYCDGKHVKVIFGDFVVGTWSSVVATWPWPECEVQITEIGNALLAALVKGDGD
jgi:hypothetical protein